MASENQAEGEVGYLFCGLVFSTQDCAGQYIARMRTSLYKNSRKIVEVLSSVVNELNDIIFVHAVLDDHQLDICRVFLFP